MRCCFRWAEDHREQLGEQNSSLEFKLHQLQFINLIRQGHSHQKEALLYARNFAPFASDHQRGNSVLKEHFDIKH